MILIRINIQDWHSDISKLHCTPCNLNFTFNQFILLKKLFHELTESFTRLIWTIKNPFLHPQEIFQDILVIHHIY